MCLQSGLDWDHMFHSFVLYIMEFPEVFFMDIFAIIAICAAGCLSGRGTCTIPGGCDCTQQWSGALCDVCNNGWTGVNCDTR